MSIITKLIARLTRPFDKTPGQILALRLSYPNGSMTWAIADDLLTTQVIGGMGENLSVDLTQYTIGSLAVFLASQPGYTVLYLDSGGYASLGAVALIEGSGDIDTSNGDHIYVATNPTWSLMSVYSKELTTARRQIEALPVEMSTTSADGEWLDLLGSYYAVPRRLGEPDNQYGPRIPAEVILPRTNNVGIANALQQSTGQPASCTDAVVFGGLEPKFDGVITFNAQYLFNATAARIFNLFDIGIGYGILGNQTPSAYLTSIRAQVDRLRAAGTHLNQLSLGPSVIGDIVLPPTDQVVESWIVGSLFGGGSSANFALGTWSELQSNSSVMSANSVNASLLAVPGASGVFAGNGGFSAQPFVIMQASGAFQGSAGMSLVPGQRGSASLAGAGQMIPTDLLIKLFRTAGAGLVGSGGFTGAEPSVRLAASFAGVGTGRFSSSATQRFAASFVGIGVGGFSGSATQVVNPGPTESPDGTAVPPASGIYASNTPGSAGAANLITIVGGQVAVNGVVAPATSNVIELFKINASVFQYNGTNWYGGITTTSTGATALTSPVPTVHLSNATLAAGSASGTAIGAVTVTTGLANGTIGTGAYTWNFALSGTNASYFQIVSGELEVAVTNLIAGTYTFTITATNANVIGSYTLAVTVTVGASDFTAPAAAVSAGYTTLVMGDHFNNPATVQLASSGGGPYNWFNFSPNSNGPKLAFNPGNSTSGAYYVDTTAATAPVALTSDGSSGMLVIQAIGEGYNLGLTTTNSGSHSGQPTSTPTNHIFSGPRNFQYGYFRARIYIDITTNVGDTGYPAWWATAYNVDLNPHCEYDMLEEARTNMAYLNAGIINYGGGSGGSGANPNGGFNATMINRSGWNNYDLLWTPSAVTIIWNDVVIYTKTASELSGASNNTISYLILGAAAPPRQIFVDFVAAWQ